MLTRVDGFFKEMYMFGLYFCTSLTYLFRNSLVEFVESTRGLINSMVDLHIFCMEMNKKCIS
jgi:hypothetical protein